MRKQTQPQNDIFGAIEVKFMGAGMDVIIAENETSLSAAIKAAIENKHKCLSVKVIREVDGKRVETIIVRQTPWRWMWSRLMRWHDWGMQIAYNCAVLIGEAWKR